MSDLPNLFEQGVLIDRMVKVREAFNAYDHAAALKMPIDNQKTLYSEFKIAIEEYEKQLLRVSQARLITRVGNQTLNEVMKGINSPEFARALRHAVAMHSAEAKHTHGLDDLVSYFAAMADWLPNERNA